MSAQKNLKFLSISAKDLIDWGKNNSEYFTSDEFENIQKLDPKLGALGKSNSNSYWNLTNENYTLYNKLFTSYQNSLNKKNFTQTPGYKIEWNIPKDDDTGPILKDNPILNEIYPEYMTSTTSGSSSFTPDYFKNHRNDYKNVDELYNYITTKVADKKYEDPLVTYFSQYDPDMFNTNSLDGKTKFTLLLKSYGINGGIHRQDRKQLSDFINNGLIARSEIINAANRYKNSQDPKDFLNLLSLYKKYGMTNINTYIPYETGDEIDNKDYIMTIGKLTKNPDTKTYFYNASYKNGGTLKYKEGGTIEDAFIAFIAQEYKTDNPNKIIKKLASEPATDTTTGASTKLDEELIKFKQFIQQLETQTMKDGAKINYLKQLKGGCPEGYEIKYFKKGGHICSKCAKKAQEGTLMPEQTQFFESGKPIKPLTYDSKTGKMREATPQEIAQREANKKKQAQSMDGGNATGSGSVQTAKKVKSNKDGGKAKKTCGGMKAACGNKLTKKHQQGGTIFFE